MLYCHPIPANELRQRDRNARGFLVEPSNTNQGVRLAIGQLQVFSHFFFNQLIPDGGC